MNNPRYACSGVCAALLLGLACSLTAAAPTTAPAEEQNKNSPSTPRTVIESVVHDSMAILRDGKLTLEQKKNQLRDIAFARMDFPTMARLTLGHYWRDLPADKRDQFVEQFRLHIAATYGHTVDSYTDEDLLLTSDQEEPRGDWTVRTRIMGTKNGTRQEIAKVEYRLRRKDEQWMVIDVTIDGVSLVANFRSQFQDIMANGGIDKLLRLLREKISQADK